MVEQTSRSLRDTAGPAGAPSPPPRLRHDEAQESGGPAVRLFVTPSVEAEVACRLTLAHYLRGRLPGATDLIRAALERSSPISIPEEIARPAAARREQALAARSLLCGLKIVDPACGEGHFLLAMLDVLDEVDRRVSALAGIEEDRRERRRRIAERSLYGVEVQPGSVGRARLNLRRAVGTAGTLDLGSNLLCGDSLVERSGFSWTGSFPQIAAQGGFDLVIANPPYVRHEQISDPFGRLPRAAYKREALAAVERRLPDFFEAGRHLDRRSDLCTLFTFLGFSLLRSAGTLGFVLPRALLEARYGQALREFLESAGRDVLTLESDCRRSFAAGVNTAILTASARRANCPSSVRHLRVAGRLDEVNLLAVALPSSRPARSSSRDRAIQLLDRLSSRMTHLGSLGRLRYPVKTGINRFFYPSLDTVGRFGIEREFCYSVLRSPRRVRTISVRPESLETILFSCDRSLEELEREGKPGALEYIRWGAQQHSRAGLPWPFVPSAQGRPYWYAVPLPPPADVICPRFFDRRFFFVLPETPLIEDQTFYGLILEEENRRLRGLLAALLSSSLAYLAIELSGRTGLGDGVLQYALCDLRALSVPDPRAVPSGFQAGLAAAFARIASRPILPVEEEMQQEDRLALDSEVAAALGLTEREMSAVRATLVELSGQRLRRARSLARSSRAAASCSSTCRRTTALASSTTSGVSSLP